MDEKCYIYTPNNRQTKVSGVFYDTIRQLKKESQKQDEEFEQFGPGSRINGHYTTV